MKIIVILLISMILVACNDDELSRKTLLTTAEASWGYEFVQVDNKIYRLTNSEVHKNDVGEFIGEVTRNIVDGDTDPELNVENGDSNSLNPGTKLYRNIEGEQSIIYEKNKTFFKATMTKW
ncbi:hypothetical protein CHH83_07105 [Bacillus sp. 7586-K]|nr:hypothetical protein CHH83_07105 [Bacillus sp. 7586-K]